MTVIIVIKYHKLLKVLMEKKSRKQVLFTTYRPFLTSLYQFYIDVKGLGGEGA